MLKIRLQRFGKKNQASFRVVLTDARNSVRSGRFHEILGWHNPRLHQTKCNNEKILHWISKGAQLSGTVNNLLIRQGVIKGKKIHVAPNVKLPDGGEEKAPEEAAKTNGESKSSEVVSEPKEGKTENAEKKEEVAVS